MKMKHLRRPNRQTRQNKTRKIKSKASKTACPMTSC
jgi:hypothetical protein